MTVKVTYRLSETGRKAAILAGRPAAAVVTEQMEFSPEFIDKVKVLTDGTLSYEIQRPWGYSSECELDAPPSGLGDVIAAGDAYLARVAEHQEKKAAEEAERQAAVLAEREAKAAADFPIVESIIAAITGPECPVPPLCSKQVIDKGICRITTPEQWQRLCALDATREQWKAEKEKAAAEAKKAEAEAKAAAREAMIAERGGLVFAVDAGFASFLGYNLWRIGQSKRWVGIFSAARGIDRFLDSPRGEFCFRVDGLQRGQCIQGGGYSLKSSGKRRDESEWFGVVVAVSDTEIVVNLCDTRAAAMKASAKL